MKTVYTPEHTLQHGQAELIDGKLVPCFEKPERAKFKLASADYLTIGAHNVLAGFAA